MQSEAKIVEKQVQNIYINNKSFVTYKNVHVITTCAAFIIELVRNLDKIVTDITHCVANRNFALSSKVEHFLST